MNKMKRLASMLLAIALLLTCAPYAPLTATASSGTCGANLTWTLYNEGILTISGTGSMNDYSYTSAAPWDSRRTSVKKVVIENGVTTIGNYAFYNCTNLTSVTIGNSVTTIGGSAFSSCGSLTSVTIPASVTSISKSAFNICNDLTSIEVDANNNNYCDIDGVLFSKDQKAILRYPEGKVGACSIPDSVTDIGDYAFYRCIGLASVIIGNSVTTIGSYAFGYCDDISGVTIPASVTTIEGYAFYGCTDMKKIYFNGNAPAIGTKAFYNVIATAYYYSNESWTTEVRQNYSGRITWVARTCNHPTFGEWGKVDNTNHERICTVCKAYFETKTHDWDSGTIIKQPTCKETGTMTYNCPTCGATKTETLAKTNNHSCTSVVTPPTCTEQGYTTHTCSECGYSYKDSYTDASGHSYGEWEKVDDTYHKRTCTVCKTATETKTHDWDSGMITKQPTCKETGTMTYNCPTCGATKTETLAKTSDHSYTSVVTPPTCTEQGYTTHACSVCGDTYKDTYVKENGHSYGKWEKVDDTNHKHTCTVCKTATESKTHDWDVGTITKAPTCKETGTKVYRCPTCGATKTETLAKTNDHSYTSIVTPPTCTEQGYTTHTCSVCGNSYKDTYVDASGHSYGKWETVDDTNHKRTCTVCKTATETKTHDWDSGTVTKQPTCKETGIKTYNCPTCGATKTETLAKTNDHSYTSVVTPPTCTEQGYTTHTCSVCGDTYKDTYVKENGHSYNKWEEVDETYHKHTCTICKTHSETAEHTFGEDHICTGCGYKAYIVGDFTGDGLITDEDVIYLLWYTVFPEDYPLNQSGDIDGDGYVTDADVIYLLWHTVFPEDYPLKK